MSSSFLSILRSFYNDANRSILHDEKVYPDPHTFNPERFLKDGKLDPNVASPEALFGFGRRSVTHLHCRFVVFSEGVSIEAVPGNFSPKQSSSSVLPP